MHRSFYIAAVQLHCVLIYEIFILLPIDKIENDTATAIYLCNYYVHFQLNYLSQYHIISFVNFISVVDNLNIIIVVYCSDIFCLFCCISCKHSCYFKPTWGVFRKYRFDFYGMIPFWQIFHNNCRIMNRTSHFFIFISI